MKTLSHRQPPKRKISTALTGTSESLPLSIVNQLANISQWGDRVSSVLVAGQHEPHGRLGTRWLKSNHPNPPIKNLLSAYLTPGNEVGIILSPEFHLGGGQQELLDFVFSQRMDLSWMAYAHFGGYELPVAFVASKSVFAHVAMAIPADLSFANSEWKKWLHGWAKNLMPAHRYLDITKYGIAVYPPAAFPEPIPVDSRPFEPVLNAYDKAYDELPGIVAARAQERADVRDAFFKQSGVVIEKRKPGRPKKS